MYRYSMPLIDKTCPIHNHKALDMICIFEDCPKKGIYCKACSYYSHHEHSQYLFPIEKFWNQVQNLIVEKSNLIFGRDVDDIFELKNSMNTSMNEIPKTFHEIVKNQISTLNMNFNDFYNYLDNNIQAYSSLIRLLCSPYTKYEESQGTISSLINQINLLQNGSFDLSRFTDIEEILDNLTFMMNENKVNNEGNCNLFLNKFRFKLEQLLNQSTEESDNRLSSEITMQSHESSEKITVQDENLQCENTSKSDSEVKIKSENSYYSSKDSSEKEISSEEKENSIKIFQERNRDDNDLPSSRTKPPKPYNSQEDKENINITAYVDVNPNSEFKRLL